MLWGTSLLFWELLALQAICPSFAVLSWSGHQLVFWPLKTSKLGILMVNICLVCCLLCLTLHYTYVVDSCVELIRTRVMLCLLKMDKLGCRLVNNCLVGCLFCLTYCFFAGLCVCHHPSSEGSLQLWLWMAFHWTLVVSFVACTCMCNE